MAEAPTAQRTNFFEKNLQTEKKMAPSMAPLFLLVILSTVDSSSTWPFRTDVTSYLLPQPWPADADGGHQVFVFLNLFTETSRGKPRLASLEFMTMVVCRLWPI